MRSITTMLLLAALCVVGCSSQGHELDDRFSPLKRIRESVLRPGTAITTLGDTAWVNDLDKWLKSHPPDGPLYDGILLHEQEHSVRQKAYGLNAWLKRYLTDTDFMRDEELRGWYVQLREFQRRGLRIIPESVAEVLSDPKNYKNFKGAMMSYEDALTWVRDVLAGRWYPSKDD